MFSSTAEYALRAVAYLATRPDGLANSQTIAEHTKVPPGYLSKIMKELANAGVVRSQRGPNGGFSLAGPPESVSVLAVINAVDPIRRITTCPLGIPSHGTNLCRLHRHLDDAIAMVEKTLTEATIAQMIHRDEDSTCAFPMRAGSAPMMPTIRSKGQSNEQRPTTRTNGPRKA